MKIVENNWLNLINLIKRILISIEIVYHLKNKKKITNLLKKDILNLRIEKNNPNNNLSTKEKE